MISIDLARNLKLAGLNWTPRLHDFFTVPETILESRRFVVSDMMVDVQQLFGKQMITFNGSVEWSLDYITIADALWLPTESQLRGLLLQRLKSSQASALVLESTAGRSICRVTLGEEELVFEAKSASDAYARALLHVGYPSSGSSK